MKPLINILRACSTLACRRPKRTWLTALLLAALSIALTATRLEMKTSNLDLVDPAAPQIADFIDFAETFGTPNVLIIVLEGDNPQALQNAAQQIAPTLRKLHGVRNLLYRTPLDQEWLDQLGLDKYIMSRDQQTLYLFVQPNDPRSNATEIEPFVHAIRQTLHDADLQKQGITAGLTGIPEYALNDKEFIQKDIQTLALFSLAGILLIFIIGFRSWKEPLAACITLLMASIYTLGAVTFAPGHLTLLSASFISILFGLGIDFGLHIIKRIQEFQNQGHPQPKAITLALNHMYNSLLTGALTTSLVLFAMQFSGLRGFAELGFIAGIGVLLSLLCMITLLPAALLIIGPSQQKEKKAPPAHNLTPTSGRLTLLIIILLGIACAMPTPPFNSDYLALQPKNSQAVRLERDMIQHSDFSPQFAAFRFNDETQAAAFADRLLDEPLIGEVRTLAGLHNLGLPQDQLQKLNTSLRAQFISDSGQHAVYAYPTENVWEPQAQTAFVHRMQQLRPTVTGMPIIGQYMFQQSKASLHRMTLIALSLLTLCLLIDFRNPRLALAAMLPTLLAFTLMRLWMNLLHLHFNPINLMALPVILGIAIDDGIHIVHRFIQEHGDINKTLQGTGRSVLLTSLTSMTSFGALAFGAHRGLASFGLLLFIGVASALLISLTLLPYLLQRYKTFWLNEKIKS